MKTAFLLKKKVVVGEKVQQAAEQKSMSVVEKRKIVQQTDVEQQVSKIAKIFDTRGKMLAEALQSLVSLNKNMVMAVYATAEEMQRSELMSSQIQKMKSFLDENRGGGKRDTEIEDDIALLKDTLNMLSLSRSLGKDLVRDNAREFQFIHAMIEKISKAASEIRSLSNKMVSTVQHLDTLKRGKAQKIQGLEEKKESLKFKTIELINSKKTVNDNLDKISAHRDSVAEELTGLRATVEKNAQDINALCEKRAALNEIKADRDATTEDLARLDQSLSKLRDDIDDKEKDQKINFIALERLQKSVEDKRSDADAASAELICLRSQEEELGVSIETLKGVVAALEKDNAKRQADYDSELHSLKDVSLSHRQDLDEQASVIAAFSKESERLREANQAAGETLSSLSNTLARESDACSLLRVESDQTKKQVDDASVEVTLREDALLALKKHGQELCLQVAVARRNAVTALHADMTTVLCSQEKLHEQVQEKLSSVAQLAQNSSAYQQRLRATQSSSSPKGLDIQDIEVLSEAAREACSVRISEKIGSSMHALMRSFAEEEREKKAILQDLRGNKKLKQKEEKHRDKILEWREKLDGLRERVKRARAGADAVSSSSASVSTSIVKSISSKGKGKGKVYVKGLKVPPSQPEKSSGLTLISAPGVAPYAAPRYSSSLKTQFSDNSPSRGAKSAPASGPPQRVPALQGLLDSRLTKWRGSSPDTGYASPTAFIQTKGKGRGKGKGKGKGKLGLSSTSASATSSFPTREASTGSLSFQGDWFEDVGGW